tara:strand:- start:503 stop:1051 length:549 start_codon:yes stop_codon:yes gene_type:complete
MGKYIPASPRRSFNLLDVDRYFQDSKQITTYQITGEAGSRFQFAPNFTYGSTQNDTISTWYTNVLLLGGSPKYYFNTEHYGYYSDFLQQGHDGRFASSIATFRKRTVTSPAVRVRFVEDDYDEDNLNFRKFSLVRPRQIEGTSAENYQSSNISLYATSSLPFFDDGVPLNRTYAASSTVTIS